MKKYIWPEPPGRTAMPIARPGYSLIIAAAFATAIFAVIGFKLIALLGLAVTAFTVNFFRDPDRMTPDQADAAVSPADGKVIIVDVVEDCPYVQGQFLKISIFMNVFNVHVNRIPFPGTVKRIEYFPGKFVSANLDKASTDNERNAVILETDQGKSIAFVQIAGLVARRIICHLQEGDTVERGRRYGMICFGSRLDVYLPPDTEPKVAVGDKVQAGTSILGVLR